VDDGRGDEKLSLKIQAFIIPGDIFILGRPLLAASPKTLGDVQGATLVAQTGQC